MPRKTRTAQATSAPARAGTAQPLLRPPKRVLPPWIDWNVVAKASTDPAVPPEPRAAPDSLTEEPPEHGTFRFALQSAKELPLRDQLSLRGLALYPCVRARVLQHDDHTELYVCQLRSFWPLDPPRSDVQVIVQNAGAEAIMPHLLWEPKDRRTGSFRLARWLYQPLLILIHEIAHLWLWRRWYYGDLEGGLLHMRQYEAYQLDVLNAMCQELFDLQELGKPTDNFYPGSLHYYLAREWLGSASPVDVQRDRSPEFNTIVKKVASYDMSRFDWDWYLERRKLYWSSCMDPSNNVLAENNVYRHLSFDLAGDKHPERIRKKLYILLDVLVRQGPDGWEETPLEGRDPTWYDGSCRISHNA